MHVFPKDFPCSVVGSFPIEIKATDAVGKDRSVLVEPKPNSLVCILQASFGGAHVSRNGISAGML